MITWADDKLTIKHDGQLWEAVHQPSRFGGAESIEVSGHPLIHEETGYYVDEFSTDSAVIRNYKAHRKAGGAQVLIDSYLPFGAEPASTLTYQYAANRVRVSLDVEWPAEFPVRRHFGVNSLFLPGSWLRYYHYPPALHMLHDQKPAWREISPPSGPEAVMIGHWHRPPPALVFEREDKTRVEIGTGTDLWRWEENMEFGPEAGSYKILLEPKGIRLIREPLMTCYPVTPRPRNYKFSWYLAWNRRDRCTTKAKPLSQRVYPEFDSNFRIRPETLNADGSATMIIDVARMPWPEDCLRWAPPYPQTREDRSESSLPCWANSGTQKRMRACIRQIRENCKPGSLCFRNLNPGMCWRPHHVVSTGSAPRPHWDMSAILTFTSWVRQQLGNEWHIWAERDEPESRPLPSRQGLFLENGFT